MIRRYLAIAYLLVAQVRYRIIIFKCFRINFIPWLHVLHLILTSESDSKPTDCEGTILEVRTFHSHFWDCTYFQSTIPDTETLKVLMDTISLVVPSQKPASLPNLLALHRLPNRNKSVTVASPLENYVAGLTYPLLTTEKFSNRASPPRTSPVTL